MSSSSYAPYPGHAAAARPVLSDQSRPGDGMPCQLSSNRSYADGRWAAARLASVFGSTRDCGANLSLVAKVASMRVLRSQTVASDGSSANLAAERRERQMAMTYAASSG